MSDNQQYVVPNNISLYNSQRSISNDAANDNVTTFTDQQFINLSEGLRIIIMPVNNSDHTYFNHSSLIDNNSD
ncbi:hypothetical protein C1645_839417 [Glomus cerebriforme]|uniref:Uncharacterized protein n=1 Tax=Glomus cerebriforme TaxID=658196 RepID=A0A397S0S1_9GLOM|nr:hypothetical protein C1645_839417 [Glomus cerebriforme]